MKLTNEQKAYVENYISNFDVKYYEIYMEILDHMILSVEDILEEDRNIPIEKAVLKAKIEGFGRFSFNEIVEERMEVINKLHRKEYKKHLKSYFTFPYFLMTLIIFLNSYYAISFFKKQSKIVSVLMIIMIVFPLIDWTVKRNKFKNKEGRKVLKMENFKFIFSFIYFWFAISQAYYGFGLDNFTVIAGQKTAGAFFITMSFLSYLFYINSSKKIMEELQQQIFA